MKKYFNIALIILFSLFLLTPTIVQVFDLEKNFLAGESKKGQSFPKINVMAPKQTTINLRDYYKNHFGLRNTIFERYKDFTQSVLNESPIPTKVINGSDNWLFMGDGESNALSESIGFTQFSSVEMNQLKNKVQSQKKWLEKKGIQYYIAVAPNKHSIYTSNLPFKISKIKNRLDIFIEEMSKKSINIIDLRKSLIPRKDSIQLFRKYDTHWNDFGAFISYGQIMDTLELKNPELKNNHVRKEKIVKDTVVYTTGDLMRMLRNTEIKERRQLLKVANSKAIEQGKKINTIPFNFHYDPDIYEYRYKNSSKKLKILIFRDSFSQALRKYFNETFSESVYIWDFTFNKELIKKEKPDIVFYITVERFLEKLLN